MKDLALDFLREQLNADGSGVDPWEWYLEARERRPELSQYFLEPARESIAPNYYVLRQKSDDPDAAILEQYEFISGENESLLPWFKIPGNMAGDASVTKRSAGKGPTPNVTKQTFKRLKSEADSKEAWSQHFREAYETLSSKKVIFKGEEYSDGRSALDIAIQIIPEEKSTSLLTFANSQGLLPGEDESYARYLNKNLPLHKYTTKDSPAVEEKPCSLCSRVATLYPNALPGAGLNLSNADRAGVFPSLEKKTPWKKFALCAACADLLFVFSYWVQNRFIGRVAGGQSLLIPYTTIDPAKRKKFMKHTQTYVETTSEGKPIVRQEDRLRRLADEEDSVTTITILWATFGQVLDNISGIVTDILPSRLNAISEVAEEIRTDYSPPFPEFPCFDFDIAFNLLGEILRRPKGKRNEKANNGARLFDLRRDIAASAYHGRHIPTERFWEEVREISEAYMIDALKSGSFGLINEGVTKKGDRYLTMAGWVRHVCKFIYFLRRLEVYPKMSEWRYEPHNERLKEFFADSDGRTGIDSPEKAYAFLLGALFGRLLRVQGGRGVNVGANALTWLRRLTLTGNDLPYLHNKIWQKLSTYRDLGNSYVQEVMEELAYLGLSSGTKISLNQTETGYFLILGQSLSFAVIPSGGNSSSGSQKGETNND
jgi:CRISPR-associated protein Csh1